MDSLIKKYFQKFWKETRKLRKSQILDLAVESKEGSKILDCGCDDGSFTQLLAKKLHSNNVHAIEINSEAAKVAKGRGIKVKKSDLNFRFPYEKSYFDFVVADQVIEHLWNLDNFASEVNRVLKKGGRVIISTENLASWHNVLALIAGIQPFTGPTASRRHVIGFHPLTPNTKAIAQRYLNYIDVPEHTKVLTLTALISLFKTYDFNVEKAVCSGYFPFWGTTGQILSYLDKRHSFFVTISATKK